jgi:hypothetical protein
MKTFILIAMLCHLNPNGQESCVPLVADPPVYYPTEEVCNKAAIGKRKELVKTAKLYDLKVTEVYSTCIEEKMKLPV